MTTLNDQLNAEEDRTGLSTFLPIVFVAAIIVLGYDALNLGRKKK